MSSNSDDEPEIQTLITRKQFNQLLQAFDLCGNPCRVKDAPELAYHLIEAGIAIEDEVVLLAQAPSIIASLRHRGIEKPWEQAEELYKWTRERDES